MSSDLLTTHFHVWHADGGFAANIDRRLEEQPRPRRFDVLRWCVVRAGYGALSHLLCICALGSAWQKPYQKLERVVKSGADVLFARLEKIWFLLEVENIEGFLKKISIQAKYYFMKIASNVNIQIGL